SAVSPGIPRVLVGHQGSNADLIWRDSAKDNPKSSYRRAALAKWMTDPADGAGALVARVLVNRLWQHHFGRGIVSTPNDFGTTGQKPTHPELLEWMASELVHNQWRLKPMHKQIMTSETYMQSNRSIDDTRAKIDPDNLLWWHREPRRLEAESIRDSMLVVSGLLDRRMYGPGTLDPNMKRRSVYFFIKRSQLIPMMMLFDWPEHLVSIGQRQSTTIAPQALAFMNNPLARSAAESLANEISDIGQLDKVFMKVLSRQATETERQAALRFIARAEQTRREQNANEPEKMAWADFCQILLCCNEFILSTKRTDRIDPLSLHSRRSWLQRSGCGFGWLGLQAILAQSATSPRVFADGLGDRLQSPLAPREPHFPARAKRVVWIFVNGGPSHVDTWDY
ncbi:MAG: DUF1553 domain-containing protein, partial [Planctomycetota bacterium]